VIEFLVNDERRADRGALTDLAYLKNMEHGGFVCGEDGYVLMSSEVLIA
jgi:hypothetical protein